MATLDGKCRFLFISREGLYFEMTLPVHYTRNIVASDVYQCVGIGVNTLEHSGKYTDRDRAFHEHFSDRSV